MIEMLSTQVYTIKEVAQYLKCSTRKMYRLLAAGALIGFKVGSQRRFRGDEIIRFVEQQIATADRSDPSRIQPDKMYAPHEVALFLRLSPSQAAQLLRSGELPGFRVGMEWRCQGRDLLKRIEAARQAQRAPETPPPAPEPSSADEE